MAPKTDRRELNEPTKNQIIGMSKAGLSGQSIANALGLIKSTVNRIIKRHKVSGSVENIPGRGRHQKLTERDQRHILINLKKDRRSTLKDLADIIPSEPSKSMIRRTLHESGIESRIAVKKPFINRRNRAKRLAFASKYKNLTVDDWKHILWTDESSFEIGKNSKQVRVWRSSSERFHSSCLAPTFKSGRQTVMVWGCFMWGKRGPLEILPEGRVNGKKYVNALENVMLDFWMEQSEEQGYVVLQEDNAPIHTCKLASKWRESRGIVSLPWPPNSPDLNPIENIWYLLKASIQKMNPRPMTLPKLKDAIKKAWNKCDVEIMNRLVESMPDRIAAVIEAQGGSTKY
jgi:transposase